MFIPLTLVENLFFLEIQDGLHFSHEKQDDLQFSHERQDDLYFHVKQGDLVQKFTTLILLQPFAHLV